MLQTPFELMVLKMHDVTPTKDGGVLKKIIKQGTGQIIPDNAIVRGIITLIFYCTQKQTNKQADRHNIVFLS